MTSGTGAPATNDVNKAWWNERSVGAVRSDMREYATYAAAGNQDYIARCYGIACFHPQPVAFTSFLCKWLCVHHSVYACFVN